MKTSYDIVVIGGGHAGTEAAAVAARAGATVALVTTTPETIGAMSCNPSIGGVGKGHLVREIDVFDGIMAAAADDAAIHYRMLNRSRGPAVHGPRVQADRRLYRDSVQRRLTALPTLTIIAGHVETLVLTGGRVDGVRLLDGTIISARAVIVTAGTFLRGRLFEGRHTDAGGRRGAAAADTLGAHLEMLGIRTQRLKTGTPPRLDGRTIDWARLDRQDSDADDWRMSPLSTGSRPPQSFCAVTRTTYDTHAVIRAGLAESPLHSGAISGQGPRYCPSIEDKVARFGDRDGHQLFLEPEGLDDPLVYPNGFSTSLPASVQQEAVRTVPGLERARIAIPGYAVEYDAIDPRALDRTLQLRAIGGLFFAGQVNGTTGYEEAAAQGLAAGLGAVQTQGGAATVFDRASSYIGVMIDDLVLQGVTEPYRMLTSRAERRLHLRADNATSRLGGSAIASGAIGPERQTHVNETEAARAALSDMLSQMATGWALAHAGWPIAATSDSRPLSAWLRNPDISTTDVVRFIPSVASYERHLTEVITDLRYASYIERDDRAGERHDGARRLRAIDYHALPGLSAEMAERLSAAAPQTLDEARRIRGVTPTALALLAAVARAA